MPDTNFPNGVDVGSLKIAGAQVTKTAAEINALPIVEQAAVIDVATADAAVTAVADAVVAAGATPTKAEYDAVVALANDLKAKYNAAVPELNEVKAQLNGALAALRAANIIA